MWAKIKIILFFVVFAVIQAELSPRIAVFGVKPDFLLIVVIIWGISFGAERGGVAGFGAGLIEDILSSGFYINTLIKAIAGAVAGMIRGGIAVASTLVCTIAVAILTPLSYVFELLLFYFFFGRPLPSVPSIFLVILLSSVYNSLLTLLLSVPLSAVIERVGASEGGDMKEYKLYRV